MRLLIVGHGFVGKAVDYGFSNPKVQKTIIDPRYETDIKDVTISEYDAVFVCVPTPMSSSGAIDTTVLDYVLEVINSQHRSSNTQIIIKSTVTPDHLANYGGRGIVYNPEFLREKTALEDFVSPDFHVFGGYSYDCQAVHALYNEYSSCRPCPAYYMSYEEASMVKYTINSFLATKVTFFNQLYDVATKAGVNFNKIINAVEADPRIGSTHMRVPGFDNKRGFGGACFPKDTAAFVNYTDEMTLLNKVIEINNEYRSRYELDDREKAQFILYNRAQKK